MRLLSQTWVPIYMPPFLVYDFLWWLKMKYIVVYKIVILCYSILNEPKPPPPILKNLGWNNIVNIWCRPSFEYLAYFSELYSFLCPYFHWFHCSRGVTVEAHNYMYKLSVCEDYQHHMLIPFYADQHVIVLASQAMRIWDNNNNFRKTHYLGIVWACSIYSMVNRFQQGDFYLSDVLVCSTQKLIIAVVILVLNIWWAI